MAPCAIADTSANLPVAATFPAKPKENSGETRGETRNPRWNSGTRVELNGRKMPRRRLKILNAATYVQRMTKAANEPGSLDCQGLHKGPVLPYGSSRTVRLAVTRQLYDGPI
jgi:hypothetical protein